MSNGHESPEPHVQAFVDRLTHELSGDLSTHAIAETVLRDVCDFFGHRHLDPVAHHLASLGFGSASAIIEIARRIAAEPQVDVLQRIFPN